MQSVFKFNVASSQRIVGLFRTTVIFITTWNAIKTHQQDLLLQSNALTFLIVIYLVFWRSENAPII